MRNVISSVGVLVVSVALLAGCSETEEPSTESVSATQPEQAPAAEAAEPEAAEEKIEPLVVEIAAHVALRSDRRLMVEGESNLPDETLVQIIVEREISSVRWRERTRINDGVYAAGPFGPGSGLPDGGYVVRVEISESSVQPKLYKRALATRASTWRESLLVNPVMGWAKWPPTHDASWWGVSQGERVTRWRC